MLEMKSLYRLRSPARRGNQVIPGRKACTDPKLGQVLSEEFLDWLQSGMEAKTFRMLRTEIPMLSRALADRCRAKRPVGSDQSIGAGTGTRQRPQMAKRLFPSGPLSCQPRRRRLGLPLVMSYLMMRPMPSQCCPRSAWTTTGEMSAPRQRPRPRSFHKCMFSVYFVRRLVYISPLGISSTKSQTLSRGKWCVLGPSFFRGTCPASTFAIL